MSSKFLKNSRKNPFTPFALENVKGMHAAYLDLGDGDKSVNVIVERCKALKIVNGG